MHPTSRPATDPDEQASLWAARLDGGTLEDTARRELDAWLAADPGHRARLTAYCQLSTDLERMLAPQQAAAAPATSRPAGAGRRRWIAGGLAAAALIAISLVLLRPAPTAFATPVATRQTLRLEDGTTVELNARSNLIVEHTAGERRVRLVEGEAFFSVSQDARRPFQVDTPAGSVRVTGTRFNVRSESAADFEVIVAEGSVTMTTTASGAHPAATAALVAGDRATAEPGAIRRERLAAGSVENALAWRRGELVGEGMTLRQLAQRLERFYGRRVSVNPAIASRVPGGIYRLQGFEDNVRDLASGLDYRVVPAPDGFRIEP